MKNVCYKDIYHSFFLKEFKLPIQDMMKFQGRTSSLLDIFYILSYKIRNKSVFQLKNNTSFNHSDFQPSRRLFWPGVPAAQCGLHAHWRRGHCTPTVGQHLAAARGARTLLRPRVWELRTPASPQHHPVLLTSLPLVGLDVTVSLMFCLFSLPRCVSPERRDLFSSVYSRLSLEQHLEHRFKSEGEMSAGIAQYPSALSQGANSVDSP